MNLSRDLVDLTSITGHGMPNATLCGKAVVEMLLGQMHGMRSQDVMEELISSGDLPKAYLISKERIDRSRKMDTVEAQDRKWGSEPGRCCHYKVGEYHADLDIAVKSTWIPSCSVS